MIKPNPEPTIKSKEILDLPNGEQKVVKKKKYYKSTPKKNK